MHSPIFSLLSGIILATGCFVARPVIANAPSRLLVKWKDGPRSLAAAEANSRIGAKVKRNLGALGWQIVELPSGMNSTDGVQVYQGLSPVLAVEPDQRIRASAAGVIPNDPMFSQQWHLAKISATNAWATTTGSTGVVVAVFDTGVDYTHPDLRTNLWRNPGETGFDTNGLDKATNGFDDDSNGYADDVYGVNVWDGNGDPMDTGWFFPPNSTFYHGTEIAGIIGAGGNNALGVAGINWSVKIMSLKVVAGDDTNPEIFRSYSTGGMLAAWNYVLEMKRRGVNVRVTSHSEGLTAYSTAVREAIVAAGDAGILTVVAADNNAVDHDLFSTYANVQNLAPMLYVAASDASDSLAGFSDFGRSTVHLAAPGVDLPTTTPGAGYRNATGTSYACPLVAGAAALLLAAHPTLTVDEMKAALLGSVDKPAGLQGRLITGGRLNVARALEYLTNVNPAPIVITALPAGQRTPVDFPIQVSFSRPMDRVSVENAFVVTPSISGSFAWAVDGRSFSYVPGAPFDRTTNFTVRIRGSAQDENGRTLDGNYNRGHEGSPADDFVWAFRFPVSNDNFANAQELGGSSGAANGNNRYTILEDGELDHGFSAYGLGSVWYRWTAPNSDWFTFDLTGSAPFDSFLAIYTGSELARLIPVATNDNYGVRQTSRVSFPVTAGTNYAIAVIGKSAVPNLIPFTNSTPFTLTWYPTPPPVLTSFSPATAYPGQKLTLNGTNFTGATRVLINGVPMTFALATNAAFLDLTLSMAVPGSATTGPLTIETPHGNFTTTSNLTVITLPRLTIQQLPAANLLELSWPSTAGFNLQRTDALISTSTWAAASAVATRLVNGIRYVTVTNAVPNRFFRLYRP